MESIKKTVKDQQEELLGLYETLKVHSYEFCIALIFIACLIVVGLILMALFLYPVYYSFHKIIEGINAIPPYSPFQDPYSMSYYNSNKPLFI